jgi:hypothetical protein
MQNSYVLLTPELPKGSAVSFVMMASMNHMQFGANRSEVPLTPHKTEDSLTPNTIHKFRDPQAACTFCPTDYKFRVSHNPIIFDNLLG